MKQVSAFSAFVVSEFSAFGSASGTISEFFCREPVARRARSPHEKRKKKRLQQKAARRRNRK